MNAITDAAGMHTKSANAFIPARTHIGRRSIRIFTFSHTIVINVSFRIIL